MRAGVLDIGGTAIKSGLWDGTSLSQVREMPTPCDSAEALTETAVKLLTSLGSLDAAGVSTRGQVGGAGEILFDNGPIPDYTGTPLRAILEERLGIPVRVENDVNAAALGEACLGAGRGARDFLCITYGTCVGGAIFQNGALWRGANYSAGEFGAMQLFSENPQGEGLCAAFYENLAATSALVRLAQAIDPSLENGRQICARWEDSLLRPAIDQWVRYVSLGLSTLIHIFDPPLLVLGGGIMQDGRVVAQVEDCTRGMLMPGFESVRFVPAQLGNSAGMVGAGSLAEQALKQENIAL